MTNLMSPGWIWSRCRKKLLLASCCHFAGLHRLSCYFHHKCNRLHRGGNERWTRRYRALRVSSASGHGFCFLLRIWWNQWTRGPVFSTAEGRNCICFRMAQTGNLCDILTWWQDNNIMMTSMDINGIAYWWQATKLFWTERSRYRHGQAFTSKVDRPSCGASQLILWSDTRPKETMGFLCWAARTSTAELVLKKDMQIQYNIVYYNSITTKSVLHYTVLHALQSITLHHIASCLVSLVSFGRGPIDGHVLQLLSHHIVHGEVLHFVLTFETTPNYWPDRRWIQRMDMDVMTASSWWSISS